MSDRRLAVEGLRVDLRADGERRPLVRGVDLALPAGTLTGLAGVSGSGKTLTALSLMGLADPNAFHVACDRLVLDGESLDLADRRRMQAARGSGLAMVFQDPATALDPVFTVGAQLRRAVARLPDLDRAAVMARTQVALAEVGFADPQGLQACYPHQLSGGMRQLCVIAMAHALRPAVLLADEPTTALDAVTQALVLHRLQRLAEEHGTAVLLISHDLRLLARYTSGVHVMVEGAIVEQGPAGAVLERPAHANTRALVAALPRVERAGERRGAPAEKPGDTPLLRLRGVRGSYRRRGRMWSRRGPGTVRAVRGVNLDLYAGRIHGLAGQSGSGKSTLARLLVGLAPLAGGTIRFRDSDYGSTASVVPPGLRRAVQLVFQDPVAALSPRRSIAQTLAEPARHFGLDASEDRLVQVLETVGLRADALHRRPHQFSSGQRQRIAIARALVCEPEFLVADEALSALDVAVQADILALLRRLRDERGLGILLISHDLALLAEHTDDVGVMLHGHLVEHAPTDRLFGQPAHPYTRQLIAALPRMDPTVPLAPPVLDGGLGGAGAGVGCVFADRCPDAFEPCAERHPASRTLRGSPSHRVECELYPRDP